MNDERIKQLMALYGQPNSKTLINQVINEVQLDMLRKPFTSLQQIFVHCGVKFKVSGDDHQKEIGIFDEQESMIVSRLYFNLKEDGTEEFVCQE